MRRCFAGRDWEKHVERTTGDYAGIGLLVDARNGWVTVVSPMQDSPADRAGIRTGDVLFEVDGESAADWTLERAVQAMRGKLGTHDRPRDPPRGRSGADAVPARPRADPPAGRADRRADARRHRLSQHDDGAGERRPRSWRPKSSA